METIWLWKCQLTFDAISRCGCLCHIDYEQLAADLLLYFDTDSSIGRFEKFDMEPEVKRRDDVLLLCSFLDSLYVLHLRQMYHGRICLSLKTIMDVLIAKRMKIKEYLVDCLFKEDVYLNYSACKALRSYLESVAIVTRSSSIKEVLDMHFSKKLLEGNTLEAGKILLFIEHVFLMKSPKPSTVVFHVKNKCNSIAVKLSIVTPIGKPFQQVINQAIPTLMDRLVLQIEDLNQTHKFECLSRMLRILEMTVPSEVWLHDRLIKGHSLTKLLSISSSLFITDSCKIHHKVIKYLSTSEVQLQSSTDLLFTTEILTILETLFTSVLNDVGKATDLRGFGGSFHIMEINQAWSYSEFQKGNQLETQSIILLYLSSMAFLTKNFSATSEDFLHGCALSFQTFCENKMPQDWEGTPSLLCPFYIVSLFADQDDALVDALVYSLEIASNLKRYPNKDIIWQVWNCHADLYFFLQNIDFDNKVVLDFLMENDSSFLSYLVKYLKLSLTDRENVLRTHVDLGLSNVNSCGQQIIYGDGGLKGMKFGTVIGEKRMAENDSLDSETTEPTPTLEAVTSEFTSLNCITKVQNIRLVDYDLSEDDSADDVVHEEMSSTNHVSASVMPSNVIDIKQTESQATLIKVAFMFKSLSCNIEKHLNKDLFPYNAKPLVKLLKAFVTLYSCTSMESQHGF